MHRDQTTYVLGASVRWDGPWLWEQNIAHALGAEHRLLYVDPALSLLTPLRGDRAARRAILRRRPVTAERVAVTRPLSLPPATNPRMRRLSTPLLRRHLRRAARAVGIDRPVLITAQTWEGLAGAVGERFRVHVVHDWYEAGGDLLGQEAKQMAAAMDAACRAADMVVATSRRLVEGLERRGHHAELLLHGFADDLIHLYDADPPAELAGLPRPWLGYTGTIDGRLDFDALMRVAERFADGSVILVGPVSPYLDSAELTRIQACANVHMLGLKPREALPAYQSHFDVALLPYVENEWLSYASPLKLWDYLYAGPPIVGSGCLELQDFPPPLVRYAVGPEAFARAVEEELARVEEGRGERRGFAQQNTWSDRARRLDRLVEERLAR